MTEERLEQTVERAAQRLDRPVNRAFRRRSVCLAGRAAGILTGAVLMAGALSLARRGRPTAARACFAGGGVIALWGVLESIIFRKK